MAGVEGKVNATGREQLHPDREDFMEKVTLPVKCGVHAWPGGWCRAHIVYATPCNKSVKWVGKWEEHSVYVCDEHIRILRERTKLEIEPYQGGEMESKYGKTIFLSTGHTFTFREVENVVENETSLQFDYVAISDGRKKSVTFYRPEIVGHSTYEI